MQLTVVSDIFGKNSDLEDLISNISSKYSTVDLIEPYGKEITDINNEKDFYQYFQETIGLTGYIEKIFEKLKRNKVESHLLGFSVGASAIWSISNENIFHKNSKGVCFYGSQIRNFLNVIPVIEVNLIWPKYESHYNVSEVSEVLSKLSQVKCSETDFLHGFMNKKSDNFNINGYDMFLNILNNFAYQNATLGQP